MTGIHRKGEGECIPYFGLVGRAAVMLVDTGHTLCRLLCGRLPGARTNGEDSRGRPRARRRRAAIEAGGCNDDAKIRSRGASRPEALEGILSNDLPFWEPTGRDHYRLDGALARKHLDTEVRKDFVTLLREEQA